MSIKYVYLTDGVGENWNFITNISDDLQIHIRKSECNNEMFIKIDHEEGVIEKVSEVDIPGEEAELLRLKKEHKILKVQFEDQKQRVGRLENEVSEIKDLLKTKVSMSSFREEVIPIGTIVPFYGLPHPNDGKIPKGWLICDGKQYARAEYPELFEMIRGTNSTDDQTFAVPDLRGRFIRGIREGALSRKLENDQIRTHNHGISNLKGTTSQVPLKGVTAGGNKKGYCMHTSAGGSMNHDRQVGWGGTDNWRNDKNWSNSNHTHNFSVPAHQHSVTSNGGTTNTGGNETRPMCISLWWMIKAAKHE